MYYFACWANSGYTINVFRNLGIYCLVRVAGGRRTEVTTGHLVQFQEGEMTEIARVVTIPHGKTKLTPYILLQGDCVQLIRPPLCSYKEGNLNWDFLSLKI